MSLTDLASTGVVDWDFEDKRRVTVQRAGITRTRPAMKAGWRVTLELLVNLPEYRRHLNDTLVNAGRLIGIGDFRPTYGRFAMAQFGCLSGIRGAVWARQGRVRCGLAWHGRARSGAQWLGMVRLGWVRHGRAWRGFGKYLGWVGRGRFGEARCGSGAVGSGTARSGGVCCGMVRLGSGPVGRGLVWSGLSWCGVVGHWRGWVWRGTAGRGSVW